MELSPYSQDFCTSATPTLSSHPTREWMSVGFAEAVTKWFGADKSGLRIETGGHGSDSTVTVGIR